MFLQLHKSNTIVEIRLAEILDVKYEINFKRPKHKINSPLGI